MSDIDALSYQSEEAKILEVFEDWFLMKSEVIHLSRTRDTMSYEAINSTIIYMDQLKQFTALDNWS